jgi:alkylation response protein AidB-like acyl-CoA dehydrogenase
MPNFDATLRNPSDVALAAYADALAAEIAPTAAHYDQSGEFPHAHFDLLRKRGALTLTVPKALGGKGLSLYELLLFQERLARGSGSTALSLGWHLMAFAYLSFDLKWKPEVFARLARDVVDKGHLINILITERETGNLLRGARASTVARKTEAGYVIRGTKAFCSAAPALQQMIVYAWVEGEGRTAEFLVPLSERVRIIENWNTLGMRSTASHDIAFDDVAVPHDALLNYIDKGRPSSFTTGSRVFGLQIAAVYLGIATAARDFALEFADGYRSASLGGPILDAPQVQHKLGELELLLGASKTLLYGLAERWERHSEIQHRVDNEVATTKYTVTNNAVRIVELALSIVGGHGLSRDFPLERYFRDVQCGLFNPPQNDMVLTNLAQAATARQRARPARNAAPAQPTLSPLES